jgi:hypothetical protein
MLKTLMLFLLICFLYKDDNHVDHDHVDTHIQIKVENKKKINRI